MIYVKRPKLPSKLQAILARETKRIIELHNERSSLEAQGFRSIWVRAREFLDELFQHKCAYCESLFGPTRGDIEHFRPKVAAVGLDGSVQEGYWWLAYEWSNLYIVCAQCNQRYKRNRFPVDGPRAEKPSDDLDTERALLLDPCREADFEDAHLAFDAHGLVSPITRRGEVTIEVLGLNRIELVQARLSVARRVFDTAVILRVESHADLFDSRHEYAEMRRQVFAARLRSIGQELGLVTTLPMSVTASVRSRAQKRREKTQKRKKRTKLGAPSREAREDYFSGTRRIERVEIVDFKGIKHLAFDFPSHVEDIGVSSDSEVEPWLVFLGENSTGKSSILQAIALALMGVDERNALHKSGIIKPSDFVRDGRPFAQVSIRLSSLEDPIELKCTSRGFKSNTPRAQALMLGYGATRLLRKKPGRRAGRHKLVRLGNLFDPFVKLNDVESWAANTREVKHKQFGVIGEALKELLLLSDEDDGVFRRGGELRVRHQGRIDKFHRLSDGYSTVVALSLDIMLVLSRLWGGIREAEGIVLIDELGVHLHPAWKMRFVSRLRHVFPNLQFIATTHEPLCLRGLGRGETILMRRNEHRELEMVTDLPSPADLRVDQLLMSELFGLASTLDPVVDTLFHEFYALSAKDKIGKMERARLKTLTKQLKNRRHLGDSLREELMYEAIDRLLAKRKVGRAPRDLGKLKDQAVADIQALWSKHLLTRESVE